MASGTRPRVWNFPQLNQAPSTYFIYREEGRTFEDIGLWDGGSVSVTGTGEPERVQALSVTDGTLGLLRIEPILGRRFTSAKTTLPRAPERVMLTHAYWQRKFGCRPRRRGPLARGRRQADARSSACCRQAFSFLDQHPQLVLPFRFNRAEVLVGNFSYQGWRG